MLAVEINSEDSEGPQQPRICRLGSVTSSKEIMNGSMRVDMTQNERKEGLRETVSLLCGRCVRSH